MSESFHELGYTRPEDAGRYRKQRDTTFRPLSRTQTQQNHRARRIEEEHERRKHEGILEPSAVTLQRMDPAQKAKAVEQIRNAKAALRAGEVSAQTEVTIEPLQSELPFE